MSWENLPIELRQRAQWCLAAPPGMYSEKGKEPLGIKSDGTFFFASVVEPSSWMSFELACYHASRNNLPIGYVLTEDDPFTCIDFDIKDQSSHPNQQDQWTTREEYDFYTYSINYFNSYTEKSLSGRGFHTWILANIGPGVRRKGIEVYSQARFIISTGVVTIPAPIEDRSQMILGFIEHIRPKTNGHDHTDLPELDEVEQDWFIFKQGVEAANGAKFWQLWQGKWEGEPEWPSQSEADLALLSMLCFYSPSNKQVVRMFHDSELGKREKAYRQDYLKGTISLIRQRMAGEEAASASASQIAERISQEYLAAEELRRIQGEARPIEVHPLHVNGHAPQSVFPESAAVIATAAPLPPEVVAVGEEGIPWPPGVLGRVAQFIYQSAPRPVKEVAIVGAIGLMAGICGKAWSIPQSGLNLYTILIARSAIGKEAMYSGISAIVKAVSAVNPKFAQFVSFNDMASGQALIRAVNVNPSFVNIVNEWGHKLRLLAQDNASSAMITLRQKMTELYQKSGDSIVGGLEYADPTKNVMSVSGVAYSMIGETTPGTFYECLTSAMMEDGFLSRFINIEYAGDRPPANPTQIVVPDAALIDVLANISQAAFRVPIIGQPSHPVGNTSESAAIIAAFERECDRNIVGVTVESVRQMWNRASLKAQRLAAIMAVCDNYIHPVLHTHHIEWAISVIRTDIAMMSNRLKSGDVGTTQNTRDLKMLSVIHDYRSKALSPTDSVYQNLKDKGIIPVQYIKLNCKRAPGFKKFQGGVYTAIDLTIKSFVQNGWLRPISKGDSVAKYKFHGECYFILDLPAKEEGNWE